MGGNTRKHGKQRRLHRREWRTQKNCHVDSRGAFRMPGASRTAASRALLFGNDHGAFWFTSMRQFQRYAIGGINFKKMMDALAEERSFQPLTHHVGSENIGNLFQKISRA